MTVHEHWIQEIRNRVNTKLETFFEEKQNEVRDQSPDSEELVHGVRELTLRGGKRFRPVVLDAAYRCVSPEGPKHATTSAGAAIEILQSFLLIHDDWMDQDDERRGGPAVHAIFRQKGYSEHLSNSLAVLAGDLGCTYAWELLFESPFPAACQAQAYARFAQIQKEVFFGQHLDITANAQVSRMHDLKTGAYTVRGPLLLGALLGNASTEAMDSFLAWGNPIGEAFQLADDLLGTFGDEHQTGKPGNDLRNKKRTCLISEVEKLVPESERQVIHELMSAKTPSETLISAASELIVTSGAKSNVERRLQTRLDEADETLKKAPFHPKGVEKLRWLSQRLVVRSA